MARGAEIVQSADIIALPSIASAWSRGQLPAKLIDGMLAGRAVIASDLPPIAWALGETGRLVRPGDLAELTEALIDLRDPYTRQMLGAAARNRGEGMFLVDVVAPTFRDAVYACAQDYARRT